MADFIDDIKDLRGMDTLNVVNSNVNKTGDANKAYDNVTRETGGMFQRIRDINAKGKESRDVAVEKRNETEVFHTAVDGWQQTVNTQHNAIAGTDGTGATSGLHHNVVVKSGNVDNIAGYIYGTDPTITSGSDGSILKHFNVIKADMYGNDPITGGTGTVLKRIKDLNQDVNTIKDSMFGSDIVNGTTGTALANMRASEQVVDTQFHVIAGADGTGSTNGMHYSVSTWHQVVNTQFEIIAGPNGDGTGLHSIVVAKEALMNPHYVNIDAAGKDLRGKDPLADNSDYSGVAGSRILVVGENLKKGNNSEVVKVGEDLLATNSKVTEVYEDLTDNSKKFIEAVAGDIQDSNKKFVETVGSDLKTGINSKVMKVGADLLDTNGQLNTYLETGNLEDVQRISNDLQGKDNTGTAYSDATSKITTVGDDLNTGVNSLTRAVGSDLLDSNGRLVSVTSASAITRMDGVIAEHDNMVAVIANAADITVVANKGSDVTRVAGIVADVTTVAGVKDDVTEVADIKLNVTAVAGNKNNIDIVAANTADISDVANLGSIVADIADIKADITAVNNNKTNIDIVATAKISIDTVAAAKVNVDKVAENETHITTVATDIADVNTVAVAISNVNAVANDITNIDVVFTNLSSINSVHDNITKVTTVSTNIDAVTYTSNDLQGKDTNGDVYAEGNNSKIIVTANNLLKGANSEILLAPGAAVKAGEWAEKDTEVETGKYSAKYWAEQAQEIANGELINDSSANSVKVYSSEKTERLTSILIKSMLMLSDSYAELVVPNLGALNTGDNGIQFAIVSDSDNTNAFTVDEAAETVTLVRQTSFSIIIRVRLYSNTSNSRNTTLKLLDASDTVLVSQALQVNVPNDKEKMYEYVLPLDNITSDNVTHMVLEIDGDGYELRSGTIYVMSSISQDVDVDLKAINDELSGTQTGAGLESDGSYSADNTTTYLMAATGLKDADKKLDTALTDLVANAALKAQDINTSTRYTDSGNGKLYKLYMENDELILEDV